MTNVQLEEGFQVRVCWHSLNHEPHRYLTGQESYLILGSHAMGFINPKSTIYGRCFIVSGYTWWCPCQSDGVYTRRLIHIGHDTRWVEDIITMSELKRYIILSL